MINDFYQPLACDIKQVPWTGDALEYDRLLFELGEGRDQFLIINPYIEDTSVIHYIREFPSTDKCTVWLYGNEWVAKLFSSNWTRKEEYTEIEIKKPKLLWKKNPELDKLIKFDNDPFGHFEPPPWDIGYQHVWYIDPRFNPLSDKVWAVSCQPIGQEIIGTKEIGYLSTSVCVEFNEHLPKLAIDIDECYPPFWELSHECAYELDPVHQTNGERMWVVKISPTYRKPKEWKWVGTVSPQFTVEYNKDLPTLNYDLDYVIPWHDFAYEHMWMLDRKHLQNNEEDIWAIKITLTKNIIGSKTIDYISPSVAIEYNKDLPTLNYDLDYVIPWHDFAYEHMWMLDRKHLQNNEEDIWAIKMSAIKKTAGQKEIGKVKTNILDQSDVIFISYYEPNAEKNWQRVLEKAPWAKRVNGVKGIFEAHKAAADLATTDMFYVVDGDAWLVDDWEFNYQPSIFDRTCTHIWLSKNPVNNLTYGNGGVKLFVRSDMRSLKKWGIDLTLNVSKKLKVIEETSNITKFNTSEYNTWRSAFRECAKLAKKTDAASKERLQAWLTPIETAKFAEWAKRGAQQGIKFSNANDDITQVNDYDWLKERFINNSSI